jgi:hypothetical protein
MSVTSKPLYTAQYLGATDTTLYTAGAGVRTILDKVTAYNSDVLALLVSFNLVPNGGAVGAANMVVSKSIAAGDTYTFPEVVGHVIEAGGSLSGIAASASKVVVRVSGREVV